jgi:hypothetical protein
MNLLESSPVSTGENKNGPHLMIRAAFDSKSVETQFEVQGAGGGPYWLGPSLPFWVPK